MSCAGEFVGCIISHKNDRPGCQNFSAGGVVAVPANTLHSAENPGCTPTRAMQALSGAVSTSHTTDHVLTLASLTMMQLISLILIDFVNLRVAAGWTSSSCGSSICKIHLYFVLLLMTRWNDYTSRPDHAALMRCRIVSSRLP